MLINKTILITGGTGSFGRGRETAKKFRDERVRFFIGDVRGKDRLYRTFGGFYLKIAKIYTNGIMLTVKRIIR